MIGFSAVVSFDSKCCCYRGEFNPHSPADNEGERDKNQTQLWSESPHHESNVQSASFFFIRIANSSRPKSATNNQSQHLFRYMWRSCNILFDFCFSLSKLTQANTAARFIHRGDLGHRIA
jgi:hypothetical protein